VNPSDDKETEMATRNGSAQWNGDLKEGSGRLTVGDDVWSGDYSFASRFEDGEGTNPEELIAAAHSACFTMALSAQLSEAGHVPNSVKTTARVQIRNVEGLPTIDSIKLETEGDVPGIDQATFEEQAEAARAGCAVSRALAGVNTIELTAKLSG
jgi:osmotically inducible protein OsmC